MVEKFLCPGVILDERRNCAKEIENDLHIPREKVADAMKAKVRCKGQSTEASKRIA